MRVVTPEGIGSVPLLRSESQRSGDIIAVLVHYQDREKEDRPWVLRRNANMRALLNRLNDDLPLTTAWGLTSHDTLCLMTCPRYDEGPWYIKITGMGDDTYRIGYIPSEGTLPIPGSEVTFDVSGVNKASELIRFAMALSKAWPVNSDLPTELPG